MTTGPFRWTCAGRRRRQQQHQKQRFPPSPCLDAVAAHTSNSREARAGPTQREARTATILVQFLRPLSSSGFDASYARSALGGGGGGGETIVSYLLASAENLACRSPPVSRPRSSSHTSIAIRPGSLRRAVPASCSWQGSTITRALRNEYPYKLVHRKMQLYPDCACKHAYSSSIDMAHGWQLHLVWMAEHVLLKTPTQQEKVGTWEMRHW
jgi:hypothetical protein